MTGSAAFIAIAEKCEAQTDSYGPSFDREIARIFGGEIAGAFSQSVDAAALLLGKGWVWMRFSATSMSVYRGDPAIKPVMRFDGYHKSPALALVAAICRAKADSLAIAEKSSARTVLA